MNGCIRRVACLTRAIIVACLVATLPAAAENEPIVTTDLLKLRSVTSIDVARDGSKAVYAVHSIAQTAPARTGDDGTYTPAAYAYRSHLFLIDLLRPSQPPVQLTFGDRRDGSPVLSPDGSTIAFVRRGEHADPHADDDADTAGAQVWLLPLSAGEARQLTYFSGGASSPVWSPTGDRLLVTSTLEFDEIEGAPTWPSERPGRDWHDTRGPEGSPVEPDPAGSREEIRAWLAANAQQDNPAAINRLDFHGEQSLKEPYQFRHLFIVDATTDTPVSRSNATQVTRGFFDHGSGCFLPDGDRIVYTSRKRDGVHIDRVRESSIWIVDSDGANDRLVVGAEGWSYTSPLPSLDGSVIAFTAQQQDEPNYRQRILAMAPTRAGADQSPIFLTESLDRSVRSFAWMSSRGAIVFTAPDSGSVPLLTISPGLLEPAEVVGGAAGVQQFAVGNGAVVYAQTSPMNPCVLMARTPTDGEWVAHDLNEWVADKALAFPTPGFIDRPDGTRVQYWLMEPTNRDPDRTYPLCLEIHGGPSAMWGPGEASMWLEFQLLCSWGYGVVYANPRGSGGYGYEFQRGNHQNWGAGPGGDVLAAVDRALREDWVDRERLVVTGGSYAGYLTAWLVAHDNRFKAAVAQRGVYDLTTFFGEGNAWRLVPWAMGGYPWESSVRATLARESPFTHVRQIQTPLLILHASQDLRTGVSQSEMLYRALKALERPVEYVRYPNTGHELSRSGDPVQRMDRLNRIIEFFERFIENDRPAPSIPSAEQPVGSVPAMPIIPREAFENDGN